MRSIKPPISSGSIQRISYLGDDYGDIGKVCILWCGLRVGGYFERPLIAEVDSELDMYPFESFWYVALEAFKQKTGKELDDFFDDDNLKTKEGTYPQFEFTWQEENPESMKKICPKLFDKLWDH